MLESLWMSRRATSGSVRVADAIELSVLNRKWGLIWLERACRRALTTSTSCSASFRSSRTLFQILSGMPSAASVLM